MSADEADVPASDAPDGAGTAVADAEEAPAEDTPPPFKLSMSVDIQPAGPCRKHVKVQVPRADIEHYFNEVVKDLVTSAAVPGFRAGHVPRKLIEKRFRKEVNEQVRQKLLTESLQQLGEEHKLDAINEPDLKIEDVEIPETGDFRYEFDVEVRPEFDLPKYAGLKIRRPRREVTDADVQKALEKYLAQFGRLLPQDGPAEPGDVVVAELRFTSGESELSHVKNQQIRIKPNLRFTDAEVAGFDQLMSGVRAGESRVARTTISVEASQQELRGEPVEIHIDVTDVKRPQLPELTAEFLDQLSVASEEELRGGIRKVLERQLAYEQRQAARRQVLEQITAAADWDLPESLVRRQVDNALHRETLEMQQAGYTDTEIRARQNELLQQQISMTRQALKEHFVLDKLATEEKLQVSPEDKEVEIAYMAMQRGESARKVRARLEKTGLIENLEAQILERKAIDVVLSQAEFIDVTAPPPADDAEALDVSVCGAPVEPAPQPTPAG